MLRNLPKFRVKCGLNLKILLTTEPLKVSFLGKLHFIYILGWLIEKRGIIEKNNIFLFLKHGQIKRRTSRHELLEEYLCYIKELVYT